MRSALLGNEVVVPGYIFNTMVRGKMVRSSTRLAGSQSAESQEVTSQRGQPAPLPSGSIHPRESAFSSLDDINSVL